MSEQGCPISLGSIWPEAQSLGRCVVPEPETSSSLCTWPTDRQPQEWRVGLVSGLRPNTAGALMHAKEAGVDFGRSEREPCACCNRAEAWNLGRPWACPAHSGSNTV